MSEQPEQKQSEVTTNYESAIEHVHIQTETVVIIEHSSTFHQQNALVSESATENHNAVQNSDDVPIQSGLQQAQKTNYEDFHDEPSETVQNHEVEKLGENQEIVNEQKDQPIASSNNEAFDQFNDVDHNDKTGKVETPLEQQQVSEKLPNTIPEQKPAKQIQSKQVVSSFAQYQNSEVKEEKPIQVEEKPIEAKPKVQQKAKQPTKKKSKKKKVQDSQPLPVIGAESEQGRQQIRSDKKIEENNKVESANNHVEGENNNNNNNDGEKKLQVEQQIIVQQKEQVLVSQIKEEVSQVLDAGSVAAGLIIFQAQRQRIGTTLDQFLKYTAKHEKHTASQKQLIHNIDQEIQKKKQGKNPLCNHLRDYFQDYVNMCKTLYEKSYKFTKSDKVHNANPMINMKEQLMAGVDELIFLRKSTGNEYNRMGDFIANNTQKNLVKLFTDYWKAIDAAQLKHKEKKDQFFKKEKELVKRIAKVVKVYTKGKQGISQEEDLFIQMTKFINQEKDYRTALVEYGLGLLPLKKAFIKAEQALYQELQVLFNGFKNQFRTLYSIHPRDFLQVEKLQKQVKQNNTFEKLSDITDGDYVRSVLLTLQKGTVQQLTDKEFEKVLNLLHFQEIMGNTVDLLKGTTSKAFQLKNKTQQVVDTVSGNLLIFNKQTAQMKQKFIIKNINAKIVQQGVVQIDEVLKGIIFNSNRTVRITFRDNDRAEELICFLNQVHESIKESEQANGKK